MLERDRRSYEAFRKVDQAGFERTWRERTAAAVARAADEVRMFGEDIEVLEPEVAEALAAARRAEDRAPDAWEDARQLRAELERVRGKLEPREETQASIPADAADETAHHAGQEAEAAARQHAGLEEDLAEAREGADRRGAGA